MNKKFSKAIMGRARLGNRFLRTRSNGDNEALFGKLSKTTVTGKLPITNHFGNKSNLFFSIRTLTLIR